MNLEPETRREYHISAEMKKVWAVEMEMLKKLLEVCKKHNLRIWAEGGTLLGAVREHGFIPWDDDIDMAMPREDYDKLQLIAKDEFKAPYFFQTGYTDIFPKGMIKIRMDGTAAITPSTIAQKFHQGIFIDIFPLDIIPEDERLKESFFSKIEKKRSDIEIYCKHTFSFCDPKFNWQMFKLNRYVKSLGGYSEFFKRFDDLCKHYSYAEPMNKQVSLISWKVDSRYMRQKEWYNHTKELVFEDILIPVPSGYDNILRTQFGDYMKPARVPSMHGGFISLDAEHSYIDLLPKIRKQYTYDIWRQRFKKIKNILGLK